MVPQEKQGWFSRNWKWFVPVGCLSMVAILAAFVGAIIFFIFGTIKSSDVYQQAVTKAKSNGAVIRELGEPIQPGWLVSGSIKIDNGTEDANFSIPVSGPKKSGTIFATASKQAGKWNFSTLEVEVEGQEKRISLLTSPTE